MDFCTRCGTEIPSWDGGYFARNMACITCYSAKLESDSMRPCLACGVRKRPEQLRLVRGKSLCSYCASEAEREAGRHECARCKRMLEDWDEKFRTPSGALMCKSCHERGAGKGGMKVCARCGKMPNFPFFAPDGLMYCENCATDAVRSHEPLLTRVVNRIRGRVL